MASTSAVPTTAPSAFSRDRPRRLRRADAEADAHRQSGVALDAGHGLPTSCESALRCR